MPSIHEIKRNIAAIRESFPSQDRPNFLITELMLSLHSLSNNALIRNLNETLANEEPTEEQIKYLDNFEPVLHTTFFPQKNSVVHSPVIAWYAIKQYLACQEKRHISSGMNADTFFLTQLLGYSEPALRDLNYTSCFEFLPLKNIGRPLKMDSFHVIDDNNDVVAFSELTRKQFLTLTNDSVFGPFINALNHMFSKSELLVSGINFEILDGLYALAKEHLTPYLEAQFQDRDLLNITLFYHVQRLYFDALVQNDEAILSKANLLLRYLLILKSEPLNTKYTNAHSLFNGKNDELGELIQNNIVLLRPEIMVLELRKLQKEYSGNPKQLTDKINALFSVVDRQNLPYSTKLFDNIIKTFPYTPTLNASAAPTVTANEVLVTVSVANYKRHLSENLPDFSIITNLLLQLTRHATKTKNTSLWDGWFCSSDTESSLFIRAIENSHPEMGDLESFIDDLGLIKTCTKNDIFTLFLNNSALKTITEVYQNAVAVASYVHTVLEAASNDKQHYADLAKRTEGLQNITEFLLQKPPAFLLPFIEEIVVDYRGTDWSSSEDPALIHCFVRTVVQKIVQAKAQNNCEELFFDNAHYKLFSEYLLSNEVEFIALFPLLSPEKQALVFQNAWFQEEPVSFADLILKFKANHVYLYWVMNNPDALQRVKTILGDTINSTGTEFVQLMDAIDPVRQFTAAPRPHYQSSATHDAADIDNFIHLQAVAFGILCLDSYQCDTLTNDELKCVVASTFSAQKMDISLAKQYQFPDRKVLHRVLTRIVDSLEVHPDFKLAKENQDALLEYYQCAFKIRKQYSSIQQLYADLPNTQHGSSNGFFGGEKRAFSEAFPGEEDVNTDAPETSNP